MQNLGKAALFVLLLPYALFGAVEARVDAQKVEQGDVVTLVLNISGEKIQKPNIQTICGVDVISSGSHSSITINNGVYNNMYTLSYQFSPLKTCEIEPIEIEIDGKKEKTRPITVEVKPITYTADSDFILSLESTKKEVFVGESFDVSLLFKQKLGTSPLDSSFEAPVFKGFWVKHESQPQRYEENGYTITKVIYTLAAQREGKTAIEPAKMKIASRVNKRDVYGTWMQNIKWKTYISNQLDYEVKPLPQGVHLIGNFSLNVLHAQTKVNANEALTVTIEVRGEGNFEDIKSFKPYIEGVSVFDEKILLEPKKLTQKITFVADANFTIPAFSLTYLDTSGKKVKKLQTKEIPIEVLNAKTPEVVKITREKEAAPLQDVSASNSSFLNFFIGLILGVCVGVAVMFLKPKNLFKREKKTALESSKMLLMQLLPFKEDAQVKEIIEALERNLYQHQEIRIDKKLLKEVMKKYNLS